QAPRYSQPVIRLQELLEVADVEPLTGEAPAEHRLAAVQPLDEASGLVGLVPLLEVRPEQRDVVAVEEIGRDRRKGGGRIVRLLDEVEHAGVRTEIDDAGTAGRPQRGEP